MVTDVTPRKTELKTSGATLTFVWTTHFKIDSATEGTKYNT